jgi:hypothetical protein
LIREMLGDFLKKVPKPPKTFRDKDRLAAIVFRRAKICENFLKKVFTLSKTFKDKG